jgi:hypothetical protein
MLNVNVKTLLLLFLGCQWKFVPRKFVRPPKEFLIYGNEVRQTVLDHYVIKK